MKTTITKGLQSAALALVVLLGAILPATSQTLTMTTAKKVGDKIRVYLTNQTNELTITIILRASAFAKLSSPFSAINLMAACFRSAVVPIPLSGIAVSS